MFQKECSTAKILRVITVIIGVLGVIGSVYMGHLLAQTYSVYHYQQTNLVLFAIYTIAFLFSTFVTCYIIHSISVVIDRQSQIYAKLEEVLSSKKAAEIKTTTTVPSQPVAKSPNAPVAPKGSSFRKCPDCGMSVSTKDSTCYGCGYKFDS